MSITGIFAAAGPITFMAPRSARVSVGSGGTSNAGRSSSHYADMSTLYRRISELGEALEEANEVFEALRAGGARSSAGVGAAESSSALAIDTSTRASSLTGTEEVNTVPTSYSPFGPSWTGSSSSEITVGGVYDGSSGDDTLRFRVTSRTGDVGFDNINIRVYDQAGTKTLDNFTISSADPPDTPVTLNNGLTVSLSAGDARRNDVFWLNVYTSIDSEVDPDLAFNGTRNSDPNLQPGLDITAGSFFVNGEEITVAADDTVNTVLDRINASAAGVTAVYDPATELVSFEHDTDGANDITLSGDTSGFLDAMKLSGATVVLGRDSGEQDSPMQEVDALSSTAAGSITINETEVAIDPSTDSLTDVVDAINAAVPGVSASFDETDLTVTIAGSGGTVTLDDGGTGFLGNVLIDPGTYGGEASTTSGKLSQIMARKASRAMASVEKAFEKLQATELSDPSAQRALDSVVSQVEAVMNRALDDDTTEALGDAGLDIDTGASEVADLMDMSRSLFERSLRGSDFADIKETMVGSIHDDDDGLLGLMQAAVEEIETNLRRSTGDVGVYLSTYA
jgi:hypothetical protein